jgi:cutinase
MTRILITSLYYAALFAPLSLAQGDCPALPETGVQIGEPVPMVPGNIPAGCSSYEILVGQ